MTGSGTISTGGEGVGEGPGLWDTVAPSVHPVKATRGLITTSGSGGKLGIVGVVSSSVQPIKATIGSKGLGGGRECELGESLCTSVQPFKATIDTRTGSLVEGIWEIGGEGKEGGFVDGIAVEDKAGERLGE
jgi:hypothetical protein